MSKSCLDCLTKHIAQAMVLHEEEVPLGYPEHIMRVIGHLAEASRECVLDYPELAAVLRDHRLAIMDDAEHLPPYMELLGFVDLLNVCAEQKTPAPSIPPELKVDVRKSLTSDEETPS